MRVISMVPSWTETLLEAGVDVVGRTRFCIHPHESVTSIPVVGGTKNIDWEKVKALKADLLLLDEEENPKKMADEAPLPYLATHVSHLSDVARELERLSDKLSSKKLLDLAVRWKTQIQKPQAARSLRELPSIEKWITPYSGQTQFLYLIWKDPWMAVGEKTFIQSMFSHLGFTQNALDHTKKYPEVDLKNFDPKNTLLLFSSEPYPFGKRHEFAKELPHSSAIVDGEVWSWFGVRSLRFLEAQTNI